jgi:CheY-like chemotaxis protein
MRSPTYKMHVLLADDDADDEMLFREVLSDLLLDVSITTVNNGEQLMHDLTESNKMLPDILFLDLNMPRKNGFDCLVEIKHNSNLQKIPVIIFTTSYQNDIINLLYEAGALRFIRKPNNYSDLKSVIQQAFAVMKEKDNLQSSKDRFVISHFHG